MAFCVSLFFLIPQTAAKETPGFLSFSLGLYNTLDNPKSVDLRIEYRPAKAIFIKELRPWAGLELNSELSLWAGAGLLLDMKLADNIYLTPSFGLGYYTHGSSNHDLNYPLEFRSQIELAYQMENEGRLALAFSHLSNASLGRNNPGTEIVSIYYHLPVNGLF
jgi:hypothetical protein